jgi:hypothetical protein
VWNAYVTNYEMGVKSEFDNAINVKNAEVDAVDRRVSYRAEFVMDFCTKCFVYVIGSLRLLLIFFSG